jgi:hypothetical protein
MSQVFATTNWVSMKILWFLQNSLEVASMFNDSWESEFGKTFAVGASVQVKQPQSWRVTYGLAYQPQAINRLTTTINLNLINGIHFEWDSYERLVYLERSQQELEENYLRPAGLQLAQQMDSDAAEWAKNYTSNVVGVLGVNSTTIDFAAAANQRLFQKAAPAGKRHLCLDPSLMRSYVVPNVTQFNPAPEISKMFRAGVVGMSMGFEWYQSNSLIQHTAGTAATTGVTVTGAGQSGSTLSVTGAINETIKKGDKFSIASVNAVNPRTRQAGTMGAQTFTATADVTLTGGTDSVTILPAIYGPTSQYQNVDALPGNGAALTFWPGTANPSAKSGVISLALTNYAFAKAGGKLEVPKAVEKAESTSDPDTGLTTRFVRAWDQRESKMTNRFDQCYGFGNFYQDNGAVAVAGA